jgi:hypothetical protein
MGESEGREREVRTMTCVVATSWTPVAAIAEHTVKKRSREVSPKIIGIFLLMFSLTGCVTTKAFKQASAAMKDSSAAVVSSTEQWGLMNHASGLSILNSDLDQLRHDLLVQARTRCNNLAAEDLPKLRTPLRVLSHGPVGVPTHAAYDDVLNTVHTSLQTLLSPGDIAQASDIQGEDADNYFAAAAGRCLTAARGQSQDPGGHVPWTIYNTQLSCERVRDYALSRSDEQLQEYIRVASDVQSLGEAVDTAVQAAWDSDDVLLFLDTAGQAVGLAAIAASIGATQ